MIDVSSRESYGNGYVSAKIYVIVTLSVIFSMHINVLSNFKLWLTIDEFVSTQQHY